MPKRATRKERINSQDLHIVQTPKFFENRQIFARNSNQQDALDSLRNNILTILSGPPGTAKTLLSVYVACEMLDEREVDKIYYVKPVVDVPGEQGLGFLPGELEEKIAPHLAPVKDALEVFMPKGKADYLLNKKLIEFLPIEHLRGRSLNNCFIIADECQNVTTHSLMTILTRLGRDSKISVMGDKVQRDLGERFGYLSGIEDAIRRLVNLEGVGHIEFGADDIVRSGFVKSVIGAYIDLY